MKLEGHNNSKSVGYVDCEVSEQLGTWQNTGDGKLVATWTITAAPTPIDVNS